MRALQATVAVVVLLLLALAGCGGGDGDGDEGGGSFETGGERIDTPGEVSAIAARDGEVWVGQGSEGTVARLDTSTKRLGEPVRVTNKGNLVEELEVGGGSVWVPDNADERVLRISLTDPSKVRSIPVGHVVSDIEYGDRRVWAVGGTGATPIDPATNKAGETTPTQGVADIAAVEGGAVWTASFRNEGGVERIDAETGRLDQQPRSIGVQPNWVDGHDGHVWVTDFAEEAVRKVDARTSEQVGEATDLPAIPFRMVAGTHGVFIAVTSEVIVRVDPQSGEIAGERPRRARTADLALDGSTLWIAHVGGGVTRVPLD